MKANTLLTLAGIIVILILALLLVKECKKPQVLPGTDHYIIDSLAVQTLQQDLQEMRNLLNAKPKVIVVEHTVNDTTVIRDTIPIYPVGSQSNRRDYTFNAASGKDSVSVKVNTDLFSYVYTDHNNKFYYEDSLRVWLTDLNVYKYATPPAAPKGMFYLMGGGSYAKYELNTGISIIKETDVRPNLGIGYMRGLYGGYLLAAPNGANVGLTVNLTQLIGDLLHK